MESFNPPGQWLFWAPLAVLGGVLAGVAVVALEQAARRLSMPRLFLSALGALGGVLLWRGRPWGYLIAGPVLVYGVLEAVGVAVDQWFGYRADPTTSYASLGGVWLFAGLAVVGLVPAYLYLRSIGRPLATAAEGSNRHEQPGPEMGWSRLGRRR